MRKVKSGLGGKRSVFVASFRASRTLPSGGYTEMKRVNIITCNNGCGLTRNSLIQLLR